MPNPMVGKIMKNHPKKTYEELKQILTNKIAKFELTEDQVESFILLRNDFPKMAEFVMKKVICNNPQSDLKQLKKKLVNKREENMVKKGKWFEEQMKNGNMSEELMKKKEMWFEEQMKKGNCTEDKMKKGKWSEEQMNTFKA